jgi:hypothetical protein
MKHENREHKRDPVGEGNPDHPAKVYVEPLIDSINANLERIACHMNSVLQQDPTT